MDTITHGIAGALIGKAILGGEDLFGSFTHVAGVGETSGSEDPPLPKVNRGRIVTWSLMLGAIFPDSDVLRDLLSHDRLLVVTWHRSITHSLVMLPLWALLLAGLTRALASWRKWEAPSFAGSCGIYAVGILSHIMLDLDTSFGTLIWPLKWSRPAWDLLFIVDFTFTAILLVPQLLAWVYSHPERIWPRALGTWLVFMPVPVLVARLAEAVDAPISGQTVLGAMIAVTAVSLLPAVRGWGLRVRHSRWNSAGFATGLAYIALTFFAHRVALARIH